MARFVARAFAPRGAELVTRAFAPRGAEERREANHAVVEVKLSKQVSDKCCFYMPAQWAAPYLQWAAGEKMCDLRGQAEQAGREPARGRILEMTWRVRIPLLNNVLANQLKL